MENSLGKMTVTVLGTRGSVPVCGEKYRIFGSATSCIRVVAHDSGRDEGSSAKESGKGDAAQVEELYLDAGNGIVGAEALPHSHISILFTHMHIDHLLGLPFFKPLSEKGRRLDMYAAPREGLSISEAMDRLFSPPYWPLGIGAYPADTYMHYLDKSFDLGAVHIDTLEVQHPGGSSAFRLSFKDMSLVYLTDFEHTGADMEKVRDFVKDTDLLIYDGQYSLEEYDKCRGYGHSVPEVALELLSGAGFKKLLFTHHAPDHDDSFLLKWEEKIKKSCPIASFARAGEVIEIG